MENKVKESRFAGVPAWASSVLTSIATVIILSVQSGLSTKRELAGQDRVFIGPVKLVEIVDFIVFLIVIPITIFLICRKHPKSVWYTPVICNAVGFGVLIMCIIESFSDQLALLDWIIWGGSCVLSITGAVIGARIGRRRINLEE